MIESNRWLRDGNLIYTQEHYDWKNGEERFQNRLEIQVSARFNVPVDETEPVIKKILAMDDMIAALEECVAAQTDMQLAQSQITARLALRKAGVE